MLGQKLAAYIPENFYDSRLGEMKYNLDTRKRARPIELSGKSVKGTDISLELTLGSFSQNNESVFTAVIRDISERKRKIEDYPSYVPEEAAPDVA
jgi:PAS domain S-box-containing protein